MAVSSPQRIPRAPDRAWVALGVFVLLALGLAWPVLMHAGSRVPGSATWAFDEYTFLWNNWYLRHALLDLHASPLHTDLIWYPLGIDLVLYTFNFVNAALALPLDLAFSLPLASNVTLWLATALSGLGAYLLALYVLATGPGRGAAVRRAGFWTAPHLAALLAGVIYAAGSNRAIYLALGHYNFASTQWLPFYTLYLFKTLRPARRSWHDPALAGLFFALAALTEMTYAAFLALLSLVILLATWRDLRCRWAPAGGMPRLFGRLAAAAAVAALIWGPVLAPVARAFIDGGYGIAGWGESVKLSADLQGLVTPTNLNPLLAPAPAAPLESAPAAGERPDWQAELRAVEEGKGRFGDINTVFLGYVTLGLAALGVLFRAARARARPWLWSALVFGVLCLGPLLQIGGRYRFSLDNLVPEGVTLPLPFVLLHYVPFFNANRAPNRYSLLLMLALAVLAALGSHELLRRVQRSGGQRAAFRGLALVLAAAIVVEHLAVPLPTTDARIPEVYRQIAVEPGNFSILQLPLGWRDSYGALGSEDTQLQYYQAAHGKPIIGGNISRAPAFKMAYFQRIPLFQALVDLENYQDMPPAIDAAARAQAAALTALYDIRYLVTFPPIPGRYPYADTAQRVQDYALSVLPLEPAPLWESGGVRAYRVRQPALPFPFRLDLGTPGTEPYLGQGWDAQLVDQPYGATATWIDGRSAEFYLPLSAPTAATLRLSLAPLAYPGAPAQTASVSVNGVQVLAGQRLAEGWQTISAALPAAATHRGPNLVRLDLARAASPRQVFPDPASRAVIGGTGIVSPVNIEAHAFSEAYISLFDRDGRESKASASRRGYNVAVIDPGTGRVLDQRGFDTAANRYEADRLASYLAGIPRGQIVIVATKGDANAHLTPEVVAALRGLGSRVQAPDELAGRAEALVGVQGVAPGTAAEVSSAGGAFVRVSGDFRTLSAAVDWVEIGP